MADELWDKVKAALDRCPEDFLSWVFDVTPRAIREHVSNGMPKGAHGFNLQAVVGWRIRRAEATAVARYGSKSARARKELAEAKRKEEQAEILRMTRERMQGAVISRESYDMALKAMGRILQGNLSGLGKELADRVAGMRDAEKVATLIDKRVGEILESMYKAGEQHVQADAEVEVDVAAGPAAMVTAIAAEANP
jgi:phage terminase Nu1 subunit (DNA packaging protein)